MNTVRDTINDIVPQILARGNFEAISRVLIALAIVYLADTISLKKG